MYKKTLLFVISITFIITGVFGFYASAAEYDLDGRTVTIGYVHDLEDRFFSEPGQIEWKEKVEEEFNANIEFATYDSFNVVGFVEELATQVMSGDTDIDLYMIRNQMMIAAALEGLLHPLDEILDEDYWSKVNPRAADAREFFKSPIDDKYYAFVSYYGGWDDGTLLFWNKDLFEREGLQSPYELYQDNEWTWDAFKELAIEATGDTTGDGEIDQWGYATSRNWNFNYLVTDTVSQFIISNGGSTVIREDGEIKFGLDQEESLEALRFLQELYVEEQAAVPAGEMDPRTEFPEGNIAMVGVDQPDFRAGEYDDAGMEDDYSMVPMPRGPEKDEHVAGSATAHVVSIPIIEEQPEELIALYNRLFEVTEDDMDMTFEEMFDEEVENDAMIVRDEQSLEVLQWSRKNTVPTVTFTEFFIPGLIDLMDDILIEGESVSASIDAVKPTIEEFYEEELH